MESFPNSNTFTDNNKINKIIGEKEVFRKAKKFDDKGIFGIGSDKMTREEYKEYLREKNFTIQD
mgnify:CR=1 FL=1